MSLLNKGPKDNSRKKGIAAQLKQKKHEEAKVRQAEASRCTPQQQLARLDAGGFASKKERAKLAKKLSVGKGR